VSATIQFVRTMHHYGFRRGEWAVIVMEDTRDIDGRPTWLVRFPDGVTDVWVADDPDGRYEFATDEHRGSHRG